MAIILKPKYESPRNESAKIRHCEGFSPKQSIFYLDCHESTTQILAMTKKGLDCFDLDIRPNLAMTWWAGKSSLRDFR